MANKYLPHVHVYPEDDANRQIIQSLLLGIRANPNRYQVLQTQRGWSNVLTNFAEYTANSMRTFEQRYVVLLIDFDRDPARLTRAQANIPKDLADRVFIFGCLSEPEDLKNSLGHLDAVGEALGKDCLGQSMESWHHPLLAINLPEVLRFKQIVCPKIL